MRISDWSSDVCSSDLQCIPADFPPSIEQRVQPKRIRCLPEEIAFGNEAMKFAVPIHHRQRADVVVTHASDCFRQGPFWGDGGGPECHSVARFHAIAPSAFTSTSPLQSFNLTIGVV